MWLYPFSFLLGAFHGRWQKLPISKPGMWMGGGTSAVFIGGFCNTVTSKLTSSQGTSTRYHGTDTSSRPPNSHQQAKILSGFCVPLPTVYLLVANETIPVGSLVDVVRPGRTRQKQLRETDCLRRDDGCGLCCHRFGLLLATCGDLKVGACFPPVPGKAVTVPYQKSQLPPRPHNSYNMCSAYLCLRHRGS